MVLRQAVRTQGAGGLRMCCPVPGLAPQGSLPFPLSFPPRAVACCRLAWGHARGHAPTPAPSFDQRLPALLGRHDWQRPPPPRASWAVHPSKCSKVPLPWITAALTAPCVEHQCLLVGGRDGKRWRERHGGREGKRGAFHKPTPLMSGTYFQQLNTM